MNYTQQRLADAYARCTYLAHEVRYTRYILSNLCINDLTPICAELNMDYYTYHCEQLPVLEDLAWEAAKAWYEAAV